MCGRRCRRRRRAARIGDRSRRQAFDYIGVVGGRLVEFATQDAASERALATDEAINDRRIGLKAHALLQAVEEDAGDAGAFIRLAGFLLDDGGQRDEFVFRLERQIGGATVPDLVHQPGLVVLHLLQELVAGHAARNTIGLRQQHALAGNLANLTGQKLRLVQALDDLFAGQALGNGD